MPLVRDHSGTYLKIVDGGNKIDRGYYYEPTLSIYAFQDHAVVHQKSLVRLFQSSGLRIQIR